MRKIISFKKQINFQPLVATFVLLFYSLAALATPVGEAQLESTMAAQITSVPDFAQIRAEAQRRGLRVWMLGGAAASYAEHAKQNILSPGPTARTAWRLDNFLFPEQDVDLVITHANGTPETAAEMDDFLKWVETKLPLTVDGRSRWDVIGLRSPNPGRKKMALETDPNFLDQHNDSLSLGMVEITQPPSIEKIVKDLGGKANFLRDAASDEMHFIFSPNHQNTAFFREGRNPPILSAVRALEKALRYQKALDPESLARVKAIVQEWDPNTVKAGSYVANYLNGRAKRIFSHSVDLEAAQRLLKETGLQDKFLKLPGSNPAKQESLAWWLNRKPLPFNPPVGKATGRTAGSLGIHDVYHWSSQSNHRLITWNYSGVPRALESRKDGVGETARIGDGFYTFVNSPTKSTTTHRSATDVLKMHVGPEAREGIDFIYNDTVKPAVAIWKSSRYLKVVHDPAFQYSRNMTCSGLFGVMQVNHLQSNYALAAGIGGLVVVGLPVMIGSAALFFGYVNDKGWGILKDQPQGCTDAESIGKQNGCKSQEDYQITKAAVDIMVKRRGDDREVKIDLDTIYWLRSGLSGAELNCVEIVAGSQFAKEEAVPYRLACQGISAFDESAVKAELRNGLKGDELRQIFTRHGT